MNKKTQAGLEYLVTYGWALVLIISIVAVFVFVLGGPSAEVTFASSDPMKLTLVGGSVSEGTATMKLQNITGGKIKLKNITIKSGGYSVCTLNGEGLPAEGAEVEPGKVMTIECIIIGDDPAGEIELSYEDFASLERTASVLIQGEGGSASGTGWFNNGWQYRQKITLSAARVASDQSSFSVLITGANVKDAFWSKVKADGSDVVVTSSNGTSKLKRELVAINTGGKSMELWVNVPNLSSSSDTELYLYYGNALASESNDADTWDGSFKMVQHHNEAAGSILDSTSNGNNGSPSGTPVYSQTGKIGKAIDYEYDSLARFNVGSISQSGNDLTMEFWINVESYSGLGPSDNLAPVIIDWMKDGGSYTDGTFLCYIKTNPGWSGGNYATNGIICTYSSSDTQLNDLGTDTVTSPGSWQYFAFTLDDSDFRAYYNGSEENSLTGAGVISPENEGFSIGRRVWFYGRDIDALIDEVRLSNVARSADWIQTSYNNQSSPASFYSVSEEETQP